MKFNSYKIYSIVRCTKEQSTFFDTFKAIHFLLLGWNDAVVLIIALNFSLHYRQFRECQKSPILDKISSDTEETQIPSPNRRYSLLQVM